MSDVCGIPVQRVTTAATSALRDAWKFDVAFVRERDRRRGLVDQVDGFVGQEAVGDEARRQLRRGFDCVFVDRHAMMARIALAQPAQNRGRLLDARLFDHDRLEAAFERRVGLDVLAVLVERRRADALQVAAREFGLDHRR